MAAAWDPGIVGGPYKQSHIRLCDWKDLYRKNEKCLCSGAELLFLPRSKRGLSHWFPSGCDRKLELQDGILCSWISDLCGSVAWKTGVRISLPLWTDPGSVEQDSFSKEDPDISGDKLLRKLKYVIFLVFVILLPMFVVDIMGQGAPYFCKLICPAGTLEGGIPLVLLNKSMRSAVGWLYMWKNTILVITIILSIMIYRPFCKYICPLGAFYSVFNKVSVFRYRVEKEKCVHCGKCRNICQMEVDPTEDPNSAECIRCGRCKRYVRHRQSGVVLQAKIRHELR